MGTFSVGAQRAIVKRARYDCERAIGPLPRSDFGWACRQYHDLIKKHGYVLPRNVSSFSARLAYFSENYIIFCYFSFILYPIAFAIADLTFTITWVLLITFILLVISSIRHSSKEVGSRIIENTQWLEKHGEVDVAISAWKIIFYIIDKQTSVLEDTIKFFASRQAYKEIVGLSLLVLGRTPFNSFCWNKLGVSLYCLTQYALAENALRMALQIKPGSVQFLQDLVVVLIKTKRYQEALSIEMDLLSKEPRLPVVRNIAWCLLAKMNRVHDALAMLKGGESLHPQMALWPFLLSITYMYPAVKNEQEAQLNLEKAMKLNPKVGDLEYFQGINLLAAGDLEKAKEKLTRAFTLEPGLKKYMANVVLPVDENGRNWFLQVMKDLDKSANPAAQNIESSSYEPVMD